MACTLLWFRRDLRLRDHPALVRAAQRGSVIPVFILDPSLLHHPETGSARVSFMLECLRSLDQELRQRGGYLILRYGQPEQVLPELVRQTGADGVYALEDIERVYGRVRDYRINQVFEREQLRIRWFDCPGLIKDLIEYPSYRDLWFQGMRAPILPIPKEISTPSAIHTEPIPTLKDLGLASDGKPIPEGGSAAAHRLLEHFLNNSLTRYHWQLSYPAADITSRLSPYLKFGVISVREAIQAAYQVLPSTDYRVQRSVHQFVARLRWRDGFDQRYFYLPQLELQSLYKGFDETQQEPENFPTLYQAWCDGLTGFPLVDASARCLQATGFLNFRTRALHSSFLTNLLNIDWRFGALHYMRHLIDGETCIDHYQHQMQAGITHCVDKRWTRIYNPEQRGVDRCDPDADFIRRWIPELRDVPPEYLGSPWETSLFKAKDYPERMIDYKEQRAKRVSYLDKIRREFRDQKNILPWLNTLQADLKPFGYKLYQSEIQWAEQPSGLYPIALPLEDLDQVQAAQLRTWFTAHLEIKAHDGWKKQASSPV
jgi:deoxyribodipyrimidine photo-lyase